MKKILFFALVGLLSNSFYAQNFSAKICTWKYDKLAAVSITFDDASYTQYEYAYPILSKYHFNATFSLVGEWTKEEPSYSAEPGMFKIKKMGWRQLRELHKSGNEIASHGYRHRRYNKRLPLDTLAAQMKKNKILIENHIGDACYTIHYPYSFATEKTAKAAKKAGFWFGRTGGDNFNNAEPENLLLLASKAILNDTIPNYREFDTWLQQARNKWLILMYHHLFPKGSKEMRILEFHKVKNTYSLYPETFDKQMQILAEKNYWVAPIKNIGKYIFERQNTRLKTHLAIGEFIVKLESQLGKEYDEPLTIRIEVPWKKIKVKIGEKENILNNEQGEVFLEALPGSQITVKEEK